MVRRSVYKLLGVCLLWVLSCLNSFSRNCQLVSEGRVAPELWTLRRENS